jgi:uroporphyrinogen decarboxylase
VVEPNRRIVAGVRQRVPGAAVIGFPRGAAGLLPVYAAATGVDALGLDYAVPTAWANGTLPRRLTVQGNLDPLRLLAGGEQMEARIEAIIAAFAGRPHIFNLGHGIVPETPIAHVERLVEIVKRGR